MKLMCKINEKITLRFYQLLAVIAKGHFLVAKLLPLDRRTENHAINMKT